MNTVALPADAQLGEALIPAASEAGRAILEVRAGQLDVRHKADSSPVTEADRAAEAIILRYLERLAPGVPVVAEEAVEAGKLPGVGREFFLVDPLDGTKEFIKGGDDFTVNIALVRDHVPVVGIVLAPAAETLYVGVLGRGAWRADAIFPGDRTVIAVRTPGEKIDVVVPAGTSSRPLDVTISSGNGQLDLDLTAATIVRIEARSHGATIAALPATKGGRVTVVAPQGDDITAKLPATWAADEVILEADDIDNAFSDVKNGSGAGGRGAAGTGLALLKLRSEEFAGTSGTITLH